MVEPLEIFVESDENNPLHVNYDFSKPDPVTIVDEDDELIEKKVRENIKRHYKVKK